MIIEIGLVLIGSIFLWLLLRLIIRRKLQKGTARKKTEVERLEKEVYHKKEMKKHLGFHSMEKDVFEPCPREEPSYDAIADEEDTEQEYP